MNGTRIEANVRLLTAAEGGFEQLPENVHAFRAILRSGESFVVSRLIAGELSIGAETSTVWELLANIKEVSTQEAFDLLRGAREAASTISEFEDFAPGARVIVSDSFAVVGVGTIKRRMEANAV